MSERTLKQLVGALVLVVAMWAIATLLSGGGGGVPRGAGEITAVFDGVSEAVASELRMKNAFGEVVFSREHWRLDGQRPAHRLGYRRAFLGCAHGARGRSSRR